MKRSRRVRRKPMSYAARNRLRIERLESERRVEQTELERFCIAGDLITAEEVVAYPNAVGSFERTHSVVARPGVDARWWDDVKRQNTNKILERLSNWTDEDWSIGCRVGEGTRKQVLFQMLGAEYAFEKDRRLAPNPYFRFLKAVRAPMCRD